MAKKRKKTLADQAAWDERTRRIHERLGDPAATEGRIQSLLTGTFEERTQMIQDHIAKLSDRIAARKAAGAQG